MILSYTFNTFLKWEVSLNHELPYLELIIAIVITSGIVISANRVVRSLLLSFIGIRFSYYIIHASLIHKYEIFDFFNIMIFMTVLFLFLFARKFQEQEDDISFFNPSDFGLHCKVQG